MLDNTDDQNDALNHVDLFLESSKNLMIIRGKAGTGKTTLIRDIQDRALDKDWKTIPLGVWGRSVASVIQLTGIPSLTIKKYIAINAKCRGFGYEWDSFEDWYENNYSKRYKSAGKRILELINNTFFASREDMNKTLLIIDEASTLKLKELSTAYGDTEEHEQNTETKVILLGDHCQLPAAFNGSDHQLLDPDFWHSIYPTDPDYNDGEFEIY